MHVRSEKGALSEVDASGGKGEMERLVVVLLMSTA